MDLKVLDELRAEVISIVVRHQIGKMLIDLIYYLVDERLFGQTQMLLKELRANFFSGQSDDMPVEDLELFFRVSIGLLNIVLDLLDELIIGLIARQ